jgi:hypothetical protein
MGVCVHPPWLGEGSKAGKRRPGNDPGGGRGQTLIQGHGRNGSFTKRPHPRDGLVKERGENGDHENRRRWRGEGRGVESRAETEHGIEVTVEDRRLGTRD